MKTALITGITGQDGQFLSILLIENDFQMCDCAGVNLKPFECLPIDYSNQFFLPKASKVKH
jgi:hypothetical protein